MDLNDLKFRKNELELLGLNSSEKKIIVAISKMGKSITQISRHTGIPRTSILYTLRRLQEKSFARPVTFGKRRVWRSNIPAILLYIKNLPANKKK